MKPRNTDKGPGSPESEASDVPMDCMKLILLLFLSFYICLFVLGIRGNGTHGGQRTACGNRFSHCTM